MTIPVAIAEQLGVRIVKHPYLRGRLAVIRDGVPLTRDEIEAFQRACIVKAAENCLRP